MAPSDIAFVPTKGPYPVFCLNHDIFTSPNCSNFPDMLFSRPARSISMQSHPHQLIDPTWYDQRNPYLAFMPATTNYCGSLFYGPIFSRLNVRPQDIIVERHGNQFRLQGSLMDSWSRLEIALVWMLQLLGGFYHRDPNQDFAKFSHYPEAFGYTMSHRSEDIVRHCAMRSRNAFVILSSYLSYAIAISSKSADELLPFYRPSWLQYICRRCPNIDQSWLDDLRSSFVCNFSFGFRVGCFFNTLDTVPDTTVEAILRAGIPVWICWGNNRHIWDRTLPIALGRYLPDLQLARKAYQQAQASFDHHSEHMVADGLVPPSFPGSGQQYGESPLDFMRVMDVQERDLLSSSSMEETKDIEARQELTSLQLTHDKNLFSSRKIYRPSFYPSESSCVCEWVTCGPWMLRKPLYGADICLRWQAFSPVEKMYHAVADVWDLCVDFNQISRNLPSQTNFAPRPVLKSYKSTANDFPIFSCDTTMNDSNYGDHDTQIFLRGPLPQIGATIAEFQLPVHSTTPPTIISTPTVASQFMVLDPFLKVLETRYGFYPTYIKGDEPPHFKEMLKSFGATQELEALNAQGRQRIAIATFHDRLTSGERPIKLQPECSDFNPMHRHYLRLDSAPLFETLTLRHRSGTPLYILGLTNSPLPIRSQHYVLAFTNAAAVLQIFRSEWATSMVATVQGLIARGIPFNTVRFREFTHKPAPPSFRQDNSGVRASTYKFAADDYKQYEVICKNVLRTTCGRAALLDGGMIWRLALEFVHPKRVTDGPSSIARSQGQVLAIDNDYKVFDDDLHDSALSIICGKLYVSTGLLRPQSQASIG